MQNINNEKEEKSQKRLIKTLVILLFIMLLILLLIIGCNVVEPYYILMVVPSVEDEVILSFSGIVTLNGEPLSYTTVELHSDPLQTETDIDGRFFFYDIEKGEHTIYVIDDSGIILGYCDFTVTKDLTTEGYNIYVGEDGVYVVTISSDIVLISIDLELVDGKLVFTEKDVTAITNMREYIYAEGATSNTEGIIVTPEGNVILQDDSIVIPNFGMILQDGSFIASTGEYIEADSDSRLIDDYLISKVENVGVVVLTPEGIEVIFEEKTTSELPDGTQISTEEKTIIKLPDGTEISGGDITYPDGEVETADQEYIVVKEYEEDDDSDDYWVTLQPLIEDDNVYGEAPIVKDDTGSFSVNLFENYTNINGTSIIYPGATGTYDFQIANPNSVTMYCALGIIATADDESLETIPFEYRLIHTETGEYITKEVVIDEETGEIISENIDGWYSGEYLINFQFEINAGNAEQYTIEWRWSFEGDDELDTSIGSAENREYKVIVTVYASLD